jgi:hypothetical protein
MLNKAEILTIQLDRIKKTLSRLNAPTLILIQHKALIKSYIIVV